MLTTTLNEIRDASPCKDGWENLLRHLGKIGPDDEALPVATIIEANGIEDALWVIANLFGEKGRKLCGNFAADCAERVLPIWEAHCPEDKRPRIAIEAARSGDERAEVASEDAAYASRAACGAIYAATCAAYAASRAASHAAYVDAADISYAAFKASYNAAYAVEYNADEAGDFDTERAWQAAHLRKLIEEAE